MRQGYKGIKNQRLPQPLLEVFRSDGAGMFTTPDPVCLQKAFPEFFQGRWLCFHGDGSSHASDPDLLLTPVGSPTTQILPGYRGMNCAPITRQLLNGTGDYFTSSSISQPSADFSVGCVFANNSPLANGDLVSKDNGSTDRTISFRSRNDGNVYLSINSDVTNSHYAIASNGIITPGSENFCCATYKFIGAGTVNSLTMYVNGVNANTASQAPQVQTSTTGWTIGGNATDLKGTVRSAFLTEYCLTPSDVQRIQNYLFPLPQGTRGEPLTFARNSLSSMTAPDGTVIWLPPNRPAISGGIKMRPAVTNLLLWSEQFDNAAWVLGVATPPTIAANSALAPDGSLTAETVTIPSGAVSDLRQLVSGLTIGNTYTFSAWIKSAPVGSATSVRLTTNNTSTWSTGVSTIFPLTSSWKRVSVTWTQTDTTQAYAMIGNPNLDGTQDTSVVGNLLIWGAQLETGTIASDYVRSEGTQGVSAAETCTVPMPGVRTNLYKWSEDLSNAVWVKNGNVSVVANATTAPNGTVTADSASNTPGALSYWSQSVTLQNSTTYSRSVYAKPSIGTGVLVMEYDSGAGALKHADFNLLTQTVGGNFPGITSITQLADGWFRLSATATTDPTGSPIFSTFHVGAYGATGTATTIYVWGAQLETGPAATDYIPTTASAASISSLSTKEGSAQVSIVPTWTGSYPLPGSAYFLNARSDNTARLSYTFGAQSFTTYNGINQAKVPTPLVAGIYASGLTKWSASAGTLSVVDLSSGITNTVSGFTSFPSFDSTLAIGLGGDGTGQPLGSTLSDIKLFSYPKK